VSPQLATLAIACWITALLNPAYWSAVWNGPASAAGPLFWPSLFVATTCAVWIVLELVSWGPASKPLLTLLLVVAAGAAYFMQAYGVVIDRDMVTNVLQTDVAEARELLAWKLVAWIGFGAAIPSIVLWRVRLQRRPLTRALAWKAAALALAVLSIVMSTLPFLKSYTNVARNQRDLRWRLAPLNVMSAVHGYAKKRYAAPAQVTAVGTDALRPYAATDKPKLLVLMVGETARWANFSLFGYPRPTTPLAAAQTNLFGFANVTACGTSTAVSLPCMFMDVGRDGFEASMEARRESLLDVLDRSGVMTHWRDNNSGCKGVCDRISREDVSRSHVEGLCSATECWDERLLYGLQDRLDRIEHDTILVLHMKGSHGPAYYMRYPPQFGVFQPVCSTNSLDSCPRESIVNAYDNTLRYTDFVLDRTIALLRSNADRFDVAMVYASDHGESLGELGVYLHGLPYPIAPQEQKRIPMLVWLGEPGAWHLDPSCVGGLKNNPYSHDNLYHSVLGLMEVSTSVYRQQQDMFAACRRSPHVRS
jgi:lipid A ethanolaminephosphotransferase